MSENNSFEKCEELTNPFDEFSWLLDNLHAGDEDFEYIEDIMIKHM